MSDSQCAAARGKMDGVPVFRAEAEYNGADRTGMKGPNMSECIHDKLEQSPAILIVEAEPWEREELTRQCPGHCRLTASATRLQGLADGDLTT